jgi:hypothetical protein
MTCRVKGGLFRCRGKAIALCQYCGRHFCEQHAELIAEHESVCSRRNCVAKRRDLIKHLEYKEAVFARNATKQCGIEGCKHSPEGLCARCRGFFCGRHVETRDELILVNNVRTSRMATLCRHCWDRRPIWTRV